MSPPPSEPVVAVEPDLQPSTGAPAIRSMSVRFGATLIANVLRSGLSFVTGLFLARFLGAEGYGDLNFLLGSFAAFTFLLDMGTTQAFYTFISQRPRPAKMFVLYTAWTVGMQCVLMLLLIAFVLPSRAIEAVWVGQPRTLVLLACCASFASTQVWLTVSQLGEASRRTVIVQGASVVQAVLHIGLVLTLARMNLLNVAILLWILIAEFILISVVLAPSLLRHSLSTGEAMTARDVLSMFGAYCAPLVLYGAVNSLYTFGNRWLLQHFGGAAQQGYFSLGQQFATISLLAASSLLNVLWKELAEARDRNDEERVAHLYLTARRGLYSFAAVTSCFFIPFSSDLIRLTVGSEYEAAWPALALMFLYPIHQSIGQLLGTFFFATSETRAYTTFGIVTMLVSLPVTYLMLAPRDGVVPGLGLGARGLAISLVVIQLIAVNIRSWWLARRNGWAMDFGFQIAVVSVFLLLASAARVIGVSVSSRVPLPPNAQAILALAIAGSLYAAGALLTLLRFPFLGFDRTMTLRLMTVFRLRGRVS